MSNLSPNSLFHFTRSYNNLKSILENTFYPRYCYDEFDLVSKDALGHGALFVQDALPMTCFCDISMSQLSNHIRTYGNYGIGLSKEWGERKGLNPVIYFVQNSYFTKHFQIVTDSMHLIPQRIYDSFSEIQSFVKPYKGTLYRNGKPVNNDVRFYDEHEWRYVPDRNTLIEHGVNPIIQQTQYRNSDELQAANERLEAVDFRLSFQAGDVKYIIVKQENQIIRMINDLKKIKENRYDNDTIDLLASRIITVEQIHEDFY